MEKGHLFYNSHAPDIFYLTGKRVWKERLFVYEESSVLLEREEDILGYLKTLSFDRVGIDFSKVTHKEFLQVQKWVGKAEIVDKNPIAHLRMFKTEKEIQLLKESAKLNFAGLMHICALLCEGVREDEIAWAFEKYTREKGASKMAFDAIVSFGDHTAFPHHKPTDRKLKQGDAVTLDVGVILNGYASDMTRSFFFKEQEDGKFGELVKEAHEIALKMCRPGVDFSHIQEKVDHFFKEKGVFPFRKHTLGHGVGLEVHENPFVWSEERILREGMVITIEPGLYELGKSGYRHEDTILITKEGYENFYESGIWTR